MEYLKALRDQILSSFIISISTQDKNDINIIFEILNAKGKHLSDIDLIKNKIFEELPQEEPSDIASDIWREAVNVLSNGEKKVKFQIFFGHYWESKYSKESVNNLYRSFVKTYMAVPRKRSDYIDLLGDIKKNAYIYSKIINPNIIDYENKKQYLWLVQSLHDLTYLLNIVQCRIPLLALFEAKFDTRLVTMKIFKQTVLAIENFHFVYNALLSNPGNRVDSFYSNFAITLRKQKDKVGVPKLIKELLLDKMKNLLPDKQTFVEAFIQLEYSKKNKRDNLKTKYVLYKLNSYFSGKNQSEDDLTIEHICSEKKEKPLTLNIGNLILLEENYNNGSGNAVFGIKKGFYSRSKNDWVKKFLKKYSDWGEESIKERALYLAEIYYNEIIIKSLE